MEANEAETESALAGAQEAQQQAVQVQRQALAEERQSLMQMRSDLQQATGQPSQTVLAHTLLLNQHHGCNFLFLTCLQVVGFAL